MYTVLRIVLHVLHVKYKMKSESRLMSHSYTALHTFHIAVNKYITWTLDIPYFWIRPRLQYNVDTFTVYPQNSGWHYNFLGSSVCSHFYHIFWKKTLKLEHFQAIFIWKLVSRSTLAKWLAFFFARMPDFLKV